MLKLYRDAGYVQVYIGIGLTVGLMVGAYGTHLLGFFVVLGGLILSIFLSVREAGSITAKSRDTNFKQHFIPVSLFYGLIYAFLLLCILTGFISGITGH